MIKEIAVKHVKGINDKTFVLNIIPNKPSLLIAPNGFGKSSITAAFSSLNRNRIKLDDTNSPRGVERPKPQLKLLIENNDHTTVSLTADEDKNEIASVFDCYVINGIHKPKAIKRNIGGATVASAYLGIDSITLVNTIPENVKLTHSYASDKAIFGALGKVIPNIDKMETRSLFADMIENEIINDFEKLDGLRNTQKIESIYSAHQEHYRSLSSIAIINYLSANCAQEYLAIEALSRIVQYLVKYDLGFIEEKITNCILLALVLASIFHSNKDNFRKYCVRKKYEISKDEYKRLFSEFNTTGVEFCPKETKGSLIVEFPSLHQISNGQRDILSFIVQLQIAKVQMKKEKAILIIDEIFDYLDEANLIAAQYYVSNFINGYKKLGRTIYPLIMTHLDPELFKGYVFGQKMKMKLYYLDETNLQPSEAIVKLLRERSDSTSVLKSDIEKYLLHYHTDPINKRVEFQIAGLKETWGEKDTFYKYCRAESVKYCNNESVYDPIAICCAVRVEIERKVYELITEQENKDKYIDQLCSGTNERIEFVESLGIDVPEIYYLLGILYNEALHWRDDGFHVQKITSKLNNITIRKLVNVIINN